MNASAPPVRVGLVGFGFAGRTFHAPLINAVDGIELVAVASRDADRVHADLPGVKVHPAPEALLADELIDVVVVATPNDTHAPLSRAALESGKHVVVDKPFALDLDEARELVSIAEAVDRHVWVFHNRRWDSDYLSVKGAIEDGMIGRVTHFESKIERFRPEVRDRWRERGGPGAGLWIDLGPHLIDQALQLFGLPERVMASLAVQRDGAQADDWAQAVLEYAERRVLLRGSALAAGGSERFIVHGTAGTLVKRELDPQESQLIAGTRPGAAGWGEDADPLRIYNGADERTVPATAGDQRAFYREVVEALTEVGSGPVRPIEALAVMAVIDAAVTSSREGVAARPALTDMELAAWNSGAASQRPQETE